jgi:hypothetical protein
MSDRTPYTSSAYVDLSHVAGSTVSERLVFFDASKLTNTFQVPIEIREIRLTARTNRPNFLNIQPSPASIVSIEGKMGGHDLTDGFVPMSIMAPNRAYPAIGGDFDDTYASTGVGGTILTSTRRILLRTPIYLKPKAGFRFAASIPIGVMMAGYSDDFTVRVYVTIIGKFMLSTDQIPMTHDLPIISHTELHSTKKISFQNELRNPIGKSITVYRLVGATNNGDSNQGSTFTFTLPDGTPLSEEALSFPRIFGQMKVAPVSFVMHGSDRIAVRMVTQNSGDAATEVYRIGLFGTRPEFVR